MARSFRKTPGWCDRQTWAKKQANKRVRRFIGLIPNGNWYRNLYNRWQICDWKFLYHTEAALRRLEEGHYGVPRYKATRK